MAVENTISLENVFEYDINLFYSLKGELDASSAPNFPAAIEGDAYFIKKTGSIGGKEVGINTLIIAKKATPTGDDKTVGSNWHLFKPTKGKTNLLNRTIEIKDFGTPFDADDFEIFDHVDNTKKFKVDVSLVSTGTTRTLIVPDKNGTIALLSDIPTATTNFSTADFTLFDPTDNTKILDFDISAITTGTTRTITIPDSNVNLGLVGTALQNILEDTTPQLGGNLDTNTFDVIFRDNNSVALGTGSDSLIYYDGTDSFWDLRKVGTGDLMIAMNAGFPSPDPNSVHLWRGDAGSVTANPASNFILEHNTNAYMSILTPIANEGGIFFGNPNSPARGFITYRGSGMSDPDSFQIGVQGGVKIRIHTTNFAFQQAQTISTTGTSDLTINAGVNSNQIVLDGASGGKVGIATATPDNTLTVNGDANISDGNGLIIGHTAKIDFGAIPEFQVLGTTIPDSSMGFGIFSNDTISADFRFLKSRGATIGSNVIVQDGDRLGRIRFQGADGADFNTTAAQMLVKVDGATSENNIFGKFIWETRSSGGGLAEKMSLNNSGLLTLISSGISLDVQNTTDAASNQVAIFRGGNRGAAAFGDNGYFSFFLDDSTETQVEFARMLWIAGDNTAGNIDGEYRFEVMNNGTLKEILNLKENTIVLNESGEDVNIRMESLNNTSMFEIDGGVDECMIGTGTPLGAALGIIPHETTDVGLIVKEKSGQTADIVQFLTSNSVGLSIESGISVTNGDIIIKGAGDLDIHTVAQLRIGDGETDSVTIGRTDTPITTTIKGQAYIDQFSTSGALPVLILDQADVSEEMIEFITTIGVGNPIEAVASKTLTTTHFIKITIPGGLTVYVPCGTIA